MRVLKILTIVCFAGLLLQVYTHINLLVSYKYEVDLMETNIKTEENISSKERSERLEHMERRKQEIAHQQFTTKILFGVFSLGLVILIVLIILIIKKNDSSPPQVL